MYENQDIVLFYIVFLTVIFPRFQTNLCYPFIIIIHCIVYVLYIYNTYTIQSLLIAIG